MLSASADTARQQTVLIVSRETSAASVTVASCSASRAVAMRMRSAIHSSSSSVASTFFSALSASSSFHYCFFFSASLPLDTCYSSSLSCPSSCSAIFSSPAPYVVQCNIELFACGCCLRRSVVEKPHSHDDDDSSRRPEAKNALKSEFAWSRKGILGVWAIGTSVHWYGTPIFDVPYRTVPTRTD